MRPRKLEIQGFASFRDHTAIDFDGCDLFVLTGPTGSGKSSVIDAVGFALYGSVARYDDQRLVEPVVTRGVQEARILLEFTVDGHSYTAARTVRRTRAGGASTSEARLECGDEVLAGDADEVTRQVEALLGLTFEQFTKCVLLPQGEFAEFLHAKPKDRQDILVRLLGFEFYREIARRAGQRGITLKADVSALDGRLQADLAGATPDAVEQVARQIESLEGLQKRIADEEPHLTALREAARKAREDLGTVDQRLEAVATLRVPDDVADLAANVASANEAVVATKELLAAAQAAEDGLAARLKELFPEADLLRHRDSYGARDRLAGLIAIASEEVAGSHLELEQAELRLAKAREAYDRTVERRDAIRRADAAYHASEGLQAGDLCPICGAVLSAPPSLSAPAGLAEAERAVEAAQKAKNTAQEAEKHAAGVLAGSQARLGALEKEREDAVSRLEGAPPVETVDAQLSTLGALKTEKALAEAAVNSAETAFGEASNRVGSLTEAVKAAWEEHDRALLTVAVLEPPTPDRADLAGSWHALVGWGSTQAERLQATATELEGNVHEAEERACQIVEEHAKACDELGLSGEPKVAVAAAIGAAGQKKKELDAKIVERNSLEAELRKKDQQRTVAEALASHLRVNNFERWLLIEALRRLSDTATVRLHELSSGQYSLAVNDKGDDFVVIDHFDADERRPVKTLSGGETFLASLSLALGLAEEVALMAAVGRGRLDALFLDEGFGTLDPDTLATVEAAIENLGAGGRMVGIVTHVRELADRIPVQFRVTKDARSSRVERFDL